MVNLWPSSCQHWETHDLLPSFLPSLSPSLHPTLPPSIPPKTHLPEYNVLLMLLLPWLLLLTSLAGPSSLAPPLGLGYQDCSRFSTSSPSIQLHFGQPNNFIKIEIVLHDSLVNIYVFYMPLGWLPLLVSLWMSDTHNGMSSIALCNSCRLMPMAFFNRINPFQIL